MAGRVANTSWGVIAAAMLCLALLAFLNREAIGFGIAVSTSDARPELLRDAQWDAPHSARKFESRFHAGTAEAELLTWLDEHQFVVDRREGHAARQIGGLPCSERIEISWAADPARRLTSAVATVSEAGCL